MDNSVVSKSEALSRFGLEYLLSSVQPRLSWLLPAYCERTLR